MAEKNTGTVGSNGRSASTRTTARADKPVHPTVPPVTIEAGDTIRMYNELIVATTNFYVDSLGKAVIGTTQLATRAEYALEEVLSLYLRSYMNIINTSLAYGQGISKKLGDRG